MLLRRVIRWTVILVIALHGLLHLLGVVRLRMGGRARARRGHRTVAGPRVARGRAARARGGRPSRAWNLPLVAPAHRRARVADPHRLGVAGRHGRHRRQPPPARRRRSRVGPHRAAQPPGRLHPPRRAARRRPAHRGSSPRRTSRRSPSRWPGSCVARERSDVPPSPASVPPSVAGSAAAQPSRGCPSRVSRSTSTAPTPAGSSSWTRR